MNANAKVVSIEAAAERRDNEEHWLDILRTHRATLKAMPGQLERIATLDHTGRAEGLAHHIQQLKLALLAAEGLHEMAVEHLVTSLDRELPEHVSGPLDRVIQSLLAEALESEW